MERGGNGLYVVGIWYWKSLRAFEEKKLETLEKEYKSDVAGEACRGS